MMLSVVKTDMKTIVKTIVKTIANTRRVKTWLLAAALASLCACVIQPPPRPGDPYYAPVIAPGKMQAPASDGSLYPREYGYQPSNGLSLFNDSKAHRIGDIITITLNERTVSSKSSTVSIDKDNETTVDEDDDTLGTLLGTRPSFKNLSLLTNLNSERAFDGDASADQRNSLQGSITVTVADVLPSGNLVVRGEKWMTLNRGEEYIRIRGIVRPEDISQSNTVASTKLANAHISYSGTGSLAESQEMGWLARFFNSAYFPF